MRKKQRLKKPIPSDTSHFKAFPPPNYDAYKPAFSFRDMRYRGKGCLSHCDRESKSSIVDRLLELSQLTWKEIHSNPREGLGYEPIPCDRFKVTLPPSVTPEVRLLVFRFSGPGRIAGYRKQDILHIVAVGAHHELY